MIYTHTFTGDDLDAEYRLVVTHNLNTKSVIPILMDNTDRQLNTADIFHLGDAGFNDKLNKCTIELAPGIPGSATYTLVLQYQSSSETSTGRKAFELSIIEDPANIDGLDRLIAGKAGKASYNLTFDGLYTWAMLNLGFLKKSNNLSDLNNKATARANLGVYSTSQVDSALAGTANLLESGSGAVLGVNNTATYIPTGQYNPATKGYVDTYAAPLAQGSVNIGDTMGKIRTLSFGKTLSDSNYRVEYSIKSNRSNPTTSELLRDLAICVFCNYSTTYVDMLVYATPFDGQVQDITIDWAVYKKY